MWFSNDWFLGFVKDKWSNVEVNDIGDFRLCKKLKDIKGILKWWNHNVFGWVDLKVEEVV